MKALLAPPPLGSSIQKVIEEARQWTHVLSTWKSSHVCRLCNSATHLMARNAKQVSNYVIWVEDTPPIIEFQILNNVKSMDICPNQ